MPSSRHNTISTILGVVRTVNPRSVLDIGIGFGKWGYLFREYLEILASEKDFSRYRKENWDVVIDGIEGFSHYITPAHRYIYNEIFEGDMRELLPQLKASYDLIFMGDVIEHIGKEEGMKLLALCCLRANKLVIVSTPAFETHQKEVCDNPLEVHRSLWNLGDFEMISKNVSLIHDGDVLISFLSPHDNILSLVKQVLPQQKNVLTTIKQFSTSLTSKIKNKINNSRSA